MVAPGAGAWSVAVPAAANSAAPDAADTAALRAAGSPMRFAEQRGRGRYDRGMKLYTRRGDQGQTDLFGGRRVNKADLRVEVYGTVDELNCAVGLAAAGCRDEELGGLMASIQAMLLELGAELANPPRQAAATPGDADAPGPGDVDAPPPAAGPGQSTPAAPGCPAGAPPAPARGDGGPAAARVTALERAIDSLCERLPPLRHFILPGGNECAARLHLARAVCRRAERLAVALTRREPGGDEAVVFLNRLSDLLFAMARRANHAAGIEDVPWTPPGRGHGGSP